MKATLINIPQRLSQREDGFCSRQKVLPYDVDNIYPQRVLNIIHSSSCGIAVTTLFAKFIGGKGFKDEAFSNLKINNTGLLVSELFEQHRKNFADLGGIAVHFNYNANYEKVEVTYIPFEYCRQTLPSNEEYPNMIVVYDDWANQKRRSIDQKKVMYFDKYDPDPNVISGQVQKAGGWDKWNGQVFWYSNAVKQYPLAPCDAVLEDLISDYLAKTFKLRNISTGFLANYILITNKKEPAADERNLNQLSSDEIEFQKNLEQYQGAENTSKILWIQKTSEEQLFDLKKIDIQDIDKLFAFTEKSVMEAILRCFGQMPQLLGIVANGRFGISQEMKDATDAYNNRTAPERKLFSNLYKKIFTGFKGFTGSDFEIEPLEPIEITDDSNAATIVSLMADPAIPDERKKQILMKVFDYTETEANEMLVKPIGI